MGFLVASCQFWFELSAVWWNSFLGLDVRLVPHQRDLGRLVFFPRPAVEVFDRNVLVTKSGTCTCLSSGTWPYSGGLHLKQINSRI